MSVTYTSFFVNGWVPLRLRFVLVAVTSAAVNSPEVSAKSGQKTLRIRY